MNFGNRNRQRGILGGCPKVTEGECCHQIVRKVEDTGVGASKRASISGAIAEKTPGDAAAGTEGKAGSTGSTLEVGLGLRWGRYRCQSPPPPPFYESIDHRRVKLGKPRIMRVRLGDPELLNTYIGIMETYTGVGSLAAIRARARARAGSLLPKIP